MLCTEKYGVSSEYGFLSSSRPLTAFPDAYYAPWDNIIRLLPDLIKGNALEEAVKSLPPLNADRLATDLELQRAYTILAFVTHGYVWSRTPPRDLVPAQLSQPFLKVCDRLGMRPVVSYAGLCIWNWQVPTAGSSMPLELELESMEMSASFTGTRGEAAFYHVPVLVERIGGHLVGSLLHAAEAIEAKSTDARTRAIDALENASRTIEHMGAQLGKMYPILDADFFYHDLRPFIGGGKGAEDRGLPRGMVFQKSNGDEVEARFVGGSAIQSSLFPFLDHLLGAVHEDGMFADMRQYMPGKHREFLAEVEKLPSLRSYVEATVQDHELAAAYNRCMKTLRAWRRKHIAVVSKYIVQPARREAEKAATAAEARRDSPMEGDGELQGTGGTALIPFLKQATDDTQDI